MTISYPIAMPSVRGPASVTIRARSIVGVSQSPFSSEQQVYVHPGAAWEMDVQLVPMKRANAEEWIGRLTSLNGMEGTFLFGDPAGTAARGSWGTASPLVNGSNQSGRTLAIDAVGSVRTAKIGDWFAIGTGTATRLYKVVADATADGTGGMTIDIWPPLRSAPADNAALTLANAKGVWRLATNSREWDIGQASIYGIRFSAIEAI